MESPRDNPPSSPPSSPSAAEAPVWVLLGRRHGDNQQLLALARAIGAPFAVIPLEYNLMSALPNLLLGPGRHVLRNRQVLPDGTPELILAAGRRPVPVVRWLQRRSAGYPRLAHLGRPWAPTRWFDLIVTTPQYALPARPNILCNLLPILPLEPAPAAELPPVFRAAIEAMPRPWTVFLLGGNSRPYVFDDTVTDRLAEAAGKTRAAHGGSVLLLGSPRTPTACLDRLEARLPAGAHLLRWDAQANPYPALRRLADRFVVTADSATMLGEALLSGRPVELFELPRRPDLRQRLLAAWRRAAVRRPFLGTLYRSLSESGLLSSVRDLSLLHERLAAAGVFDGGGTAQGLAQREVEMTVQRARHLLESPPPVNQGARSSGRCEHSAPDRGNVVGESRRA